LYFLFIASGHQKKMSQAGSTDKKKKLQITIPPGKLYPISEDSVTSPTSNTPISPPNAAWTTIKRWANHF
jgi:hypothetical protein